MKVQVRKSRGFWWVICPHCGRTPLLSHRTAMLIAGSHLSHDVSQSMWAHDWGHGDDRPN